MAYYVAWDTETARFGPGRQAPALACVSVTHEGGRRLIHWSEAEQFLDEVLYDPSYILVGHNIAYDLAVVVKKNPKYLHQVFKVFADGRVRDTMIRQKLIDIAMGIFRGYHEDPTKEEIEQGYRKGKWVTLTYDLDAVNYRYTRKRLDKDTWRLKYGALIPVPLDLWPEGAKKYPLDDSDATWNAFWEQGRINEMLNKELSTSFNRFPDVDVLGDESNQCKYLWWMYLMKAWGIRTDPTKVLKLRDETEAAYHKVAESLQNVELCPVCSRKLRGGACEAHGSAPWVRRDVKIKKVKIVDEETGKVRTKKIEEIVATRCAEPVTLVRDDGTRDTKAAQRRMILVMKGAGNCRRTPKGGIQLDEDACTASEDPLLKEYSDLTKLKNVVSKDIPALLKGRYLPIHSNFNSLIATGRTSSSKPNIQNIRRLPGIRECFVPRKGKVFLDADYDGLELRTLAQVCLKLVGQSKLADVLNAGKDPHLMVAAQILDISYEEAERLNEAGDDRVDDARQTGKVANFGFPGGLGYEALVSFAWKTYGVKITEEGAKRLKAQWMATFPEMQLYFAYIDRLCQEDPLENLAVIQQLFTKRIRGNIKYTVACNSFFQGLGSDATKNAGWLLSIACYIDKDSPLYGCRIVNYIHDQFLIECDEDKAHEACLEMARIMVEGAAPYLPDVPPTVKKPLVCKYWSKKAKQRWSLKCDECGAKVVGSPQKGKIVCSSCKHGNKIGKLARLVPWEDAA